VGWAEQLERDGALERDVQGAVRLQAPKQTGGHADEVLGRRRGQRRPHLVGGERAAQRILAGQEDRHGVDGCRSGCGPGRGVQPGRGSRELGGADDRDRRTGPIQAAVLRLLEVAGWEAGRLSAGELMPEAL
jgi:hypothetical protein